MRVRKTSTRQSGQVALFVALIFQVLFVFFAMVINVGLIVHHKINLQNSVDLAAYYGAMKQAEMMNAIGHVNYQIRQSYKLLMFRYYQLGLAGDETNHPIRTGNESDTIKSPLRPGFCITYPPNSVTAADESTCKNINSGIQVERVESPTLIGQMFSFLGFQTGIRSVTQAMNEQATVSCKKVGQINWFGLARFMAGYKVDLANRKKTAIFLANQLSQQSPTDIDGQLVREGVYKTLYKNLTPQNQDSLRAAFGVNGDGNSNSQANFEIFNSLASEQCGSTGVDDDAPRWMVEIPIFQYLRILDTDCAGERAVKYYLKAITLANGISGPNYKELITDDVIKQMQPLIDEPTGEDPRLRIYKSSLGFEKNPWCMAYFGVKASATPAIPFSPLGAVKLEARAFAKPFGGKIGPWYGTTWPQAQKKSVGDTKESKTDGLLPMRVDYGPIRLNPNDEETEANLTPDYSRYVKDVNGQRANLTLTVSARAIKENGRIDFRWWEHLLQENYDNDSGANDPVAWNTEAPATIPKIRHLELAAIAPDQFDITHYSIEPDYYNTYLTRLKKGYQGKTQIIFRGDLGSRLNGPTDELRKFSIRDQIKETVEATTLQMDFATKLQYSVSKPQTLLTSWQGKNPYDYSLDEQRFGKCLKELPPNATPEQQAAGGCIAGGRTGYSVKLVDGTYLKGSDLELGGEGVVGPLLNPPPEEF